MLKLRVLVSVVFRFLQFSKAGKSGMIIHSLQQCRLVVSPVLVLVELLPLPELVELVELLPLPELVEFVELVVLVVLVELLPLELVVLVELLPLLVEFVELLPLELETVQFMDSAWVWDRE